MLMYFPLFHHVPDIVLATVPGRRGGADNVFSTPVSDLSNITEAFCTRPASRPTSRSTFTSVLPSSSTAASRVVCEAAAISSPTQWDADSFDSMDDEDIEGSDTLCICTYDDEDEPLPASLLLPLLSHASSK
jgi:hypothetical protein